MIRKNKKLLFWIFGIVLLAFYWAVKFESPRIIGQLYHDHSFQTLNLLAHSMEDQNLDYYLGTIEENWTGPISSVAAGLLFILYVFTFLKDVRTFIFGTAVFLFLLLTKYEVLFFPPWGDHVGGSLSEAVWLARNNFDYIGLFHQKGSIWGGPKYFLFSIFPGFMALLMKLTVNPKLFILISHLYTFALTATIVALFRKICLKILDETTATLSSIFLLGLPLMQVMMEMINMDMTVTFFGFLSAYFLIERRIGLATIMAILSVLTKGSGAAFCGALLFINILFFFFDKDLRYKSKLLFYGLIAVAIALLQVYLRAAFVHTIDAKHNTVKFLCGLPAFMGHQYLTYFLYFSLFGLIVLSVQNIFRKSTAELKKKFFFQNSVFIIMLTEAAFWFILQINVSVCGPRYKLTLVPFLLFSVIMAYRAVFQSAQFLKLSLYLAIIVSFFSVYGALEGPRIESIYYAYGPLERSLEYRNDLKLHMKLAHELEENFKGFTIGAPHVTAQMLAFPEYGYVRHQLDVMMYGMSITFGDIKNYNGLSKLDLTKTIWIGYKENEVKEFPYPIDPLDKIVKEINVGDKKATLFMGGFAIEKMYLSVLLKKYEETLKHP